MVNGAHALNLSPSWKSTQNESVNFCVKGMSELKWQNLTHVDAKHSEAH